MNSATQEPGSGDIDPTFPPIRVPNRDAAFPDHKISWVLAVPSGGFVLGCNDPACLVRVTGKGEIDPTFGENGYAMIGVNGEPPERTLLAGLYPISGSLGEGYLARLEVTGTLEGRTIRHPALIRFTIDGHRDTSFGDGGYSAYLLPAEPRTIKSVEGDPALNALRSRTTRQRFWSQSNGDLAMAGDRIFLLASMIDATEGTHRAYVLKLDGTGAYDESFNERGYMEPARDTWFTPYSLLLADDKFIISGAFPGIGFIARYDEQGVLDQEFGRDGMFAELGIYGYSFWHRMLLTDDREHMVCVGRRGARNFLEGRGITVISKLDLNGQRDPTFHGGQAILLEPSREGDAVLAPFSALIDTEGRIVVSGRSMAPETPTLTGFIARRLRDGSADPAFGPEGLHENKGLQSIDEMIEEPGTGYVASTLLDYSDKLRRILS